MNENADRPEPESPSPSGSARLPPVPIPRRTILIAAGAGLAVLLFGIWLVATRLPALLTGGNGSSASPGATTDAAGAKRIQATLFYVSEDGAELVAVVRDAAYAPTRSEQARRLVEAQVAAPPSGRHTAIPAGTTVRDVFLTDRGEAYVDLGGTIAKEHSGGSLNEALAVYAIVNTLTVNLPDVTAVQILVDGKQVDTLVGHLDLRSPLGKALDWVQKGS
jgi:spore germination protein GerM